MFANVILNTKGKESEKEYDYLIPYEFEGLLIPGMRVIVPFGPKNKKTEAFCVSIGKDSELEKGKIKSVAGIMETYPVFSGNMLKLAFWMSEKYYTSVSNCLKCIMPSGINLKLKRKINLLEFDENILLSEEEKNVFFCIKDKLSYEEILKTLGNSAVSILKSLSDKNIIEIKEIFSYSDYEKNIKFIALSKNIDTKELESIKEKLLRNKTQANQLKVLNLISRDPKPLVEVLEESRAPFSSVSALQKKGAVEISFVKYNPDFSCFTYPILEKEIRFNDEQLHAISQIENEYEHGLKRPVLLHGITGSGKTEIYIELIKKALKEGKQAIVLVPEISLTAQTLGRLKKAFGDKLALTHSKMSHSERFFVWQQARKGEISVVIGPRSAIFAPFLNLGIIIVDEEHENSYKSDTTPKYDAIETAEYLAKISNAKLILGSATPSIRSYYNCMNERFALVNLTSRAGGGSLPKIFIKDMRTELSEGNFSIFSRDLFKAISEALSNNKQIILFLNRKGHSTFVSCRKCGYVLKCSRCDVSYVYHKTSDSLVCRYCGQSLPNPKSCPACGSKYIKHFGIGTQKVEEEIKKFFPSARVLRMDADTTKRKTSHTKILKDFSEQKSDILIGTQMIAKGLDFPNVSLVGIVAADVSLNFGDYRSAENTFQLITQVAGRAGRNDGNGRVYIQTYNPEHYSILCAANYDYRGFYENEMAFRKSMNYPPFSSIAMIVFSSKNEEKAIKAAWFFKTLLEETKNSHLFEILGPSPVNVYKIKDEYRLRLLIKNDNEKKLIDFIKLNANKYSLSKIADVFLNITINPEAIL